jgi:hypothetical protein
MATLTGNIKGDQGSNASTVTKAAFNVPLVGTIVDVDLEDVSWLSVGQMVYVNEAGGPGVSGSMEVMAINGNTVSLRNPPSSTISVADDTQSGLLAQLSGVPAEYVGGDNACHPLPAGGSIPLADTTQDGLVRKVTGSLLDLIDGTNNCAEIELRSTWRERYYFSWHCDHPLSAHETNGITGNGTVAPAAGEANHPGLYCLTSGVSPTAGTAYYASSTAANIQPAHFTKLAWRTVFRLDASTASGDGRGFFFGLSDSLGTLPPANGVGLLYDNSGGSRASLAAYSGGTATALVNLYPMAGDTRYFDFSLFWDQANGVYFRMGLWNGISFPTDPGGAGGSYFGPFTAGLPANTTNFFWQLLTQSAPNPPRYGMVAYIDLVEIAGEYATPGDFRGEELITNF